MTGKFSESPASSCAKGKGGGERERRNHLRILREKKRKTEVQDFSPIFKISIDFFFCEIILPEKFCHGDEK